MMSRESFNFNPRPREGSDMPFSAVPLESLISIHAPAKGATHQSTNLADDTDISIHAPAKGATDWLRPTFTRHSISIHAPAKGATKGNETFDPSSWLFQSTPPRRERQRKVAPFMAKID